MMIVVRSLTQTKLNSNNLKIGRKKGRKTVRKHLTQPLKTCVQNFCDLNDISHLFKANHNKQLRKHSTVGWFV